MLRPTPCIYCGVELAPFTLADGSVAVVCVGCDLIGEADDVARGARLAPADTPKPRPADRRHRHRPAAARRTKAA